MATQVQQEGSDMSIYHVALRTKEKLSFLEAFDMNLPSVLTKVMWILSLTNNLDEIKELFYTTINHDILYKGLSNQDALDIEKEVIAYYKSINK